MKLNQDKVPINLEDAVSILKEGLDKDDIVEIKQPNFQPSQVHLSIGMLLRNEWSLWDKSTICVVWFKKNYGIDHADDISGLILHCLCADIRGEPRKDKELAKRYIDHWKKIGNN
jgi:hypothetical protein